MGIMEITIGGNFDLTDVVLMANSKPVKEASNIWICNSGACEHNCQFVEGCQGH